MSTPLPAKPADPNELPIERLRQWDQAHVWHPFTQHAGWNRSDPLIIIGAQGDELIDAAGRRYIDGVASLWCNVHGHRHPTIDRALEDQLHRVAHTTLLGQASPPSIALARRLVELAPAGLNRVFFSDDGATAVEAACKMAAAYWRHQGQSGRTAFVAIRNAYHGDTLGAVSVGAIELYRSIYRPFLFEAHFAPSPYCYRCELGLRRETCGLACAEALGRLLEQEPGRIAAVVIEPLVQCAAGMITAPPGYLARVRRLCNQYDVLMIADEVATGFGRTGRLFACQHEDVGPDLMCLGKGLTGGYLPLAATLATDRIYDAFLGPIDAGRTFYHGHTYTGNALACRAALASLQVFDEEETLSHLPPRIETMRSGLATISAHSHVGQVRQCGLIAGIELVADLSTRGSFPYRWQIGAQVCRRARQYGVILRPLADVIVLFPPLSIGMMNLEHLLSVTQRCIEEVLSDPHPEPGDGYEG
jgi:adenosylmethionine-8-amino-7-oxononanoate aminotransferase